MTIQFSAPWRPICNRHSIPGFSTLNAHKIVPIVPNSPSPSPSPSSFCGQLSEQRQPIIMQKHFTWDILLQTAWTNCSSTLKYT